jgi:hypothetical protein
MERGTILMYWLTVISFSSIACLYCRLLFPLPSFHRFLVITVYCFTKLSGSLAGTDSNSAITKSPVKVASKGTRSGKIGRLFPFTKLNECIVLLEITVPALRFTYIQVEQLQQSDQSLLATDGPPPSIHPKFIQNALFLIPTKEQTKHPAVCVLSRNQ